MNILFKNITFFFLCACSSTALAAGINFNDTFNKAAPLNNPSFTGNVGIGSLAPGQALDVQGTVRAAFFNMSGQTPVSGYVLTASDSAGDTAWTSAVVISGGWTISGNNVYETAGGNVGIGTAAFQTALAVMNGSVGFGTWTAAGGSLIVKGGNVGIGSAWPGQLLDVQGTVRATGRIVNGNAGIGTSALQTALAVTDGNVGIGTWTASNPLSIIGGASIGSAAYANTPAPSNGLLVSGNVGLGSTAPGQALDVQGTVRVANFTMSGQTPVGGYMLAAGDNAGDMTWISGGWTVSGNNVFETAGGNVGIGTTALQTALAVTNGNVGIGTWTAAGGRLIVNGGNVGIGSAWPGQLLDVQGILRILGNGSIGVGTSFTSTSALTLMTGDVGIGTWVPGANLDVEKTSSTVSFGGNVGIGTTALSNAALTVMSGNMGIGTWVPAAALDINGSIQMEGTGRSVFSGNVGIGSAAPGKALDVNGTARMTGLTLASGASGGYLLTATDSTGDTTWTSSGIANGWTVSGYDVFETDNGNVGIGTTKVNGGNMVIMNGNVGIGTWGPTGALQIGSTQDEGNVVDVIDGDNSFFGLGAGGYYGISPELPSPPGNSTLSGYYAGLAIQSITSGGGNPIFGVLNSSQFGDGLGSVALTISDTHIMVTFNNILDDGNGNIGIDIGANIPQAPLIVNGNVGIGTWSPAGNLHVFGDEYIGDPKGLSGYSLILYQGPNGAAGGTVSIGADNNTLNIANPAGEVDVSHADNQFGALAVQEGGLPYNSSDWWFDGPSDAGTGAHFGSNGPGAAGSINFKLSDAAGVSNFNVQDSNNNQIFDVLSNGNVGIGTITPQGRLSVMNGNVGIGTFVPVTTLEVNGSLQVDQEYFYPNSGGFSQIFTDSHANLYVPQALVDSNGSFGSTGYCLTSTGLGQVVWGSCTGTVGIGTGNPAAPFLSVQYDNAGSFGGSSNFVFNGNNVGIGTVLSKNTLDIANNVSIGTLYAGYYSAPSNSLIIKGNVGIGTWVPHGALVVNGNVGINTFSAVNSTFEVVGSGITVPGSGMSVLAGNVGVGTWVPAGYFTVENPDYMTNQVVLNDGTTGVPDGYPAIPGDPLVTTFVISSAEVTGARPLWFGYKNGANWDGLMTIGACGGFTQLCVDLGNGATVDSAFILNGTNLAIGGASNAAGFGAADGNAANIYFGNTGNVYFSNSNVGIGTITPQGALVVTNGNVGIGTWVPASLLDVGSLTGGDVQIDKTGDINAVNDVLAFQFIAGSCMFLGGNGDNAESCNGWDDKNWTGGFTGFGGFDFTDGQPLTPYGSLYMHADTGAWAEITTDLGTMRMTETGNVGIGTTTPQGGLVVTNGNVGIGTWAPAATLDVSGKLRTTNFTMSGQAPANGYVMTASDSAGDATWQPATGSIEWTLSGNNVFETAGGNVGIGTTTVNQGALVVTNGNVGIGTWSPAGLFQINKRSASPFLVTSAGNVGIGTITPQGGFVVTNGNVGIGTWAPGSALVVMGGNVGIGTNQANYNLQIGGCTSPTGTTSCVDVAELIPSSESVSAGDVVMLDARASVTVKKALNNRNKLLFGVVTTNPAIVIEGSSVGIINGKGFTRQPEKPAVALAGRVPVKVNLENGPINIGDMITSSSVPGVGTKAVKPGEVIGMALEPLTNLGAQKYKSILTYINPHWWENTPLIDEELSALRIQIQALEKKLN